jgi:hypothetical protein
MKRSGSESAAGKRNSDEFFFPGFYFFEVP